MFILLYTTKERDIKVLNARVSLFESVPKSIITFAFAVISLSKERFGRSDKKVKKWRKRILCNRLYEIRGFRDDGMEGVWLFRRTKNTTS